MVNRTTATNETFDLGCELIIQTAATLSTLARAANIEFDEKLLGPLRSALETGEHLVKIARRGSSIPYALDNEGSPRAKTASESYASAWHSLRVLEALYGPQVAG